MSIYRFTVYVKADTVQEAIDKAFDSNDIYDYEFEDVVEP